MNKPTRPTLDYIDTEDGAIGVYDERQTDAYITAIEQERDEAIRLLRGIVTGAIGRIRTFEEEEFAYKSEVITFLARVEGANDD